MKKIYRKLKVKNILIAVLIFVTIIFVGIKYINYRNSNYYKLKEIGYSKEEISTIEKKLSGNEISSVLDMKYSNKLSSIIQEKYFIFKNLSEYITYYNSNKDMELSKIITKVNTNSDKDFYTNVKSADKSKGNLI
jgi:beta-mannanase